MLVELLDTLCMRIGAAAIAVGIASGNELGHELLRVCRRCRFILYRRCRFILAATG